MAEEWIGGAPTGYTRVIEGTAAPDAPEKAKAASSGLDKKTNVPKLKSPLFTDVSSEALLKQEKPSSVALRVGLDQGREVTIVIPPPTAKDIRVANSLADKTTSARQKFLRKTIEDKNTWMVAYMCAVYLEDKKDIGWFSPRDEYCFEFATDRTVLQCAEWDGNAEIVGLLLQTDHTLPEGGNIWALTRNKDKEEAKKIFDMIRDYNMSIRDHNIKDINDKELRLLLSDKRRDMRAEEEKKRRAAQTEQKQKKLAEAAKAAENVIEDDNGVVWKRLDDSSISKVTEDGEGFRLRKVFNFKSGTVSETNEYLDKEGNVTTATSPTVTSFRSLSSRGEVKQAQEKLQSILDKKQEQERAVAEEQKEAESPEFLPEDKAASYPPPPPPPPRPR